MEFHALIKEGEIFPLALVASRRGAYLSMKVKAMQAESPLPT